MTQSSLDQKRIWCIVPVYNNGKTLKNVVQGCKDQIDNIVVVDDGSTDMDVSLAVADEQVSVIRHNVNEGKGVALMTGLQYVQKQGGKYAITIDADGQLFPEDIPKFIDAIEDDLIVIGSRDFSAENVPGKSKFGRSFANFWFRVETGLSIDDCQSGYRAYPVEHALGLGIKGKHYNFETEIITKAAWAGLKLKTVDIDVSYDKVEERVSHFHIWKDNFRISITHAFLVLRRLLPIPHRKIVSNKEDIDYKALFKHPFKTLKYFLKENASPGGLAAAAFVGVVLGTLPLIATHTIAIIYVTARLHLNKVMAVSIQNICIPPFVPVLCIEIGHYMRYGTWLTEVSIDIIFYQALDRIWEWFLGSLIVAPILAALVGFIAYVIAKFLQTSTVKDIKSV